MRKNSPDQGSFNFGGENEHITTEGGRFMALCFDYKKNENVRQYLAPIDGEDGRFKADNGDIYERDENVDVYRMVVSYELPPELDEMVNKLMADPSRHLPHRDAAIELARMMLADRKAGRDRKPPRGDRYNNQEENYR